MGTGFSDEDLVNFHKFFADHIIKTPLSEYRVKIDVNRLKEKKGFNNV